MRRRALIDSRFVIALIGVSLAVSAAWAQEQKPPVRALPPKTTPLVWKLPAGAQFVGLNLDISFNFREDSKLVIGQSVSMTYEKASKRTTTGRIGFPGTFLYFSEGKPGYEVGAIDVSDDEFVEGLRVIYMRRTGDALDVGDQYDGRWQGSASTKPPKRLGGNGKPIIGITFRYEGGMRELDVIQADDAKK